MYSVAFNVSVFIGIIILFIIVLAMLCHARANTARINTTWNFVTYFRIQLIGKVNNLVGKVK